MPVNAEDERFRLFYETGVKLQSRDLELLFQRLNFFLVGTAFLITAFAAVVSSYSFLKLLDCKLVFLAHAISVVGFYLAVLFTSVNYLNTRAIRVRREYIEGLEKGDSPKPPVLTHDDKVKQLPHRPGKILIELYKGLRDMFFNPFKFSKDYPAPHTWLIPLGFFIFWGIVWGYIVLWYAPLSAILLIIILFLIRLSIMKCKEMKERRSPKNLSEDV